MPDKQSSYPQVTPADFKDPTCFRIQTIIDFLYSQVDKIQASVTAIAAGSKSNSFGNGTVGQVLTSNGAAPPTFQDLPTGATLSATPSAPLTCTASYADVPSLSVTLNKDGVWKITATLDIGIDSSSLAIFGQLVVNGVAQTGILSFSNNATSSGATITRPWLYTNSGSNVAKIQAKAAFAAGSRSVGDTNSLLIAEFLHP